MKQKLAMGMMFAAYSLSVLANCPEPRHPDLPFHSSYLGRLYTHKPNPIGGAAPDALMRSRIHRIAYHSKGLEFSNSCLAQRRLRALDSYLNFKRAKENASPESLEAFRLHAEELILKPRAFGDAIDRCFTQIRSQWLKCGGAYARTAKRMSRIRDELKVQFMPNGFMIFNSTGGPRIWAAGMASTDKRSIFVSVSTLSPDGNGNHFVRSVESLVCWELGNTFAMNHGNFAGSLDQELGFQSPCEFYRR